MFDDDRRYCVQITLADDEGDVVDTWGTEGFKYKRDAVAHTRKLLQEYSNLIPKEAVLAEPEVDEWGQTTILARQGNYELEIINYT